MANARPRRHLDSPVTTCIILINCLLLALWLFATSAQPALARHRPKSANRSLTDIRELHATQYDFCGRRLVPPREGTEARNSGGRHWRRHDDDERNNDTSSRGSRKRWRKHGRERIVGGYYPTEGEFPWYATVRAKFIDDAYETSCGGVIIHKDLILTAAHCLYDKYNRPAVYVNVIVGHYSDKKFEGIHAREIEAEKFMVHPGYTSDVYKRTLLNDLGLIRLARYIRYDEYMQPACLPLKGSNIRDSSNCRQAGMGLWGPGSFTEVQQAIPLARDFCPPPKWNDVSCYLSRFKTRFPGRACAGDSGSGIFCSSQPDPDQFYVAAIHARGPVSECEYHDIRHAYYMDTEKTLDMILRMINFM